VPAPRRRYSRACQALPVTSPAGDRRERSRTAAGLNPGPQAKYIYRLRSYLFCCSCGRRMFGNTKRQVSWYACAPKKAYRPGGHPVIFRVREDHLLDGLAGFLSEQVFGPTGTSC
jgi:site-specific DNA recombinase